MVNGLLDHYYAYEEESVKVEPFLNGRDLMQALHLKGGPEVGRLLSLVREAQIAGEISSKEEAVAYAKTHLGTDG